LGRRFHGECNAFGTTISWGNHRESMGMPLRRRFHGECLWDDNVFQKNVNDTQQNFNRHDTLQNYNGHLQIYNGHLQDYNGHLQNYNGHLQIFDGHLQDAGNAQICAGFNKF
jgi:hypothetical protein